MFVHKDLILSACRAVAGNTKRLFCSSGAAVHGDGAGRTESVMDAVCMMQAGCFVAPHVPGGIPRVGGTLAMSRAMGDVKFKVTEGVDATIPKSSIMPPAEP